MNRMKLRGLTLGIAFCGLSSVSWAQSAPVAPLATAQTSVLRTQVEQFQVLINRDLQSALDHPFGMLQDPKGIYLPGFGVVFHMELNLAPMRMMSMFDLRPYSEEELQQTRQAKLQRISDLKSHLSEVLREHGSDLSALPPEQHIVVAIHLFNMPSERTEGLPAQIVLEISREALAELQARNATPDEFRNSISIFDF
jgi:hypothetical protein